MDVRLPVSLGTRTRFVSCSGYRGRAAHRCCSIETLLRSEHVDELPILPAATSGGIYDCFCRRGCGYGRSRCLCRFGEGRRATGINRSAGVNEGFDVTLWIPGSVCERLYANTSSTLYVEMRSMRMETHVYAPKRRSATENRYSFALSALRHRCIDAVTGEFDRAGVEPVKTGLAAYITAPGIVLHPVSRGGLNGAYSS